MSICLPQFLNVLALGLLAAIMRNPEMMQELEYGFDDYDRHNEQLPTPLSKIDPYAYRDRSTVHYRKKTSRFASAVGTNAAVLLLSLSIITFDLLDRSFYF